MVSLSPYLFRAMAFTIRRDKPARCLIFLSNNSLKNSEPDAAKEHNNSKYSI